MYAWGHSTNNERARETGVLATEAMISLLPMQFAIRGVTGRLRPYQSNYQNVFFDGVALFPQIIQSFRDGLGICLRGGARVPKLVRRAGCIRSRHGNQFGAGRRQPTFSVGRLRRWIDRLPGGTSDLQNPPQPATR